MALAKEHEIHRRRLSRNIGVGVALLVFVVLVFALSVVKITKGQSMQAFDHTVRPELTQPAANGQRGQNE